MWCAQPPSSPTQRWSINTKILIASWPFFPCEQLVSQIPTARQNLPILFLAFSSRHMPHQDIGAHCRGLQYLSLFAESNMWYTYSYQNTPGSSFITPNAIFWQLNPSTSIHMFYEIHRAVLWNFVICQLSCISFLLLLTFKNLNYFLLHKDLNPFNQRDHLISVFWNQYQLLINLMSHDWT